MRILFFIILYFLIGCIIDDIAKENQEIPRSYIVIAAWPAVLLLAILEVLKYRKTKRGGDPDELSQHNDR